MPLYKIRGGFTVAMGDAGVYTGGDFVDLTPEMAKAWAAQTEPADEADAKGKRVARPRPRGPEKIAVKMGPWPV